MPEIRLRPARHTDLPHLRLLYVEMVAYHHALDARYADDATARKESEDFFRNWIHHPRALLLVAEIEGEVGGFGLITLQKPHQALASVRTARLDLLAVSKAYRRQGIGTLLVEGLLEWANKQSVERLFVANSMRNPAADAFWARHGFIEFSVTRSLDLTSDTSANEVQ